jgi:putative Mg2+ transporter-C (MgtC) family protein
MMYEFALPGFWTTLLRLLFAALFCGAVGFEREIHLGGRVAGLRTHMVVGVGSCLYMLISMALGGSGNDPGRVAAQVVTGIGFVGAGTIIRHRDSVHGLTTAASIWAAAAIGMAAGLGWYAGAFLSALVVVCVLWGVRIHIPGTNPMAGTAVVVREEEDDTVDSVF